MSPNTLRTSSPTQRPAGPTVRLSEAWGEFAGIGIEVVPDGHPVTDGPALERLVEGVSACLRGPTRPAGEMPDPGWLTERHWAVLRALADNGPLPSKRLAREAGCGSTDSLYHYTGPLRKHGLIRRSEGDFRLTSAGRQVLTAEPTPD